MLLNHVHLPSITEPNSETACTPLSSVSSETKSAHARYRTILEPPISFYNLVATFSPLGTLYLALVVTQKREIGGQITECRNSSPRQEPCLSVGAWYMPRLSHWRPG